MKKLLVVVDYQKDFVDGALGFAGAEKLDRPIAAKIRAYRDAGWEVAFTYDTHGEDYLSTQEGRLLPIPHCIKGSDGWQLYGETAGELRPTDRVFYKPVFGSVELMEYAAAGRYAEIELVGLVSDICVASNAALLKAALPDAAVRVDAACTASADPAKHAAALEVLRSIQVQVYNAPPSPNPALEALRQRRSIRSYRPEQITREELEAVLEAGTYAPTAMNLQSPIMIAVQDGDTVKKLSRLNAAVMGSEGDPFYGAPTVINVLADSTCKNHLADGSLVMGNLMLAAHGLGLGSCWINRAREVFDGAEGRAMLREWGIDDKYVGIGHCILGYPACDHPAAKPRKEGYIIFRP